MFKAEILNFLAKQNLQKVQVPPVQIHCQHFLDQASLECHYLGICYIQCISSTPCDSNVSKFDGHLWKCLHITIWTSVLMLLSFQLLPPSLLFLFFPFDVLRCHNTSITSRMVFPRLEDIVITRFTIQLSLMFIDCGRVQRFAAGFTFNTFLVEWSSVNSHERLSGVD